MEHLGKKLIISIIPSLIFVWGILSLLFYDPFFSRSIDPEYTYLVSGINCSQMHFNRIGHIDNPGTTFQVYEGIIFQITHLFSGHGKLVQDVFSRPEHYMNAISLSMTFAHVIILIFIGLIGLKREIPIWQLMILQASSFYNDVLLLFFGRCNPDRFFVLIALLFILVYLKYGYNNLSPKKFSIYSGIVMGMGFATKFNFLPLLILPFFLIKSNKKKLIYTGSLIVSFILFVSPVIDKLDAYYAFLKGMFSHNGPYGTGNTEILNIGAMMGNLKEIFRINPELGLLIPALIVMLVIAIKKRNVNGNLNSVWLFAGFLAFIFVQMIFVSKHFKNYYQAPLFATYSFIFFSIAVFLSRIIKNKNKLIMASLILPILFISASGCRLKRDFKFINENIASREKVLEFVQENVTKNDFWFNEPYWEGAPYEGNGLILGLSYCRHRSDYLPQLMEVNPNVITYEENKDQVKLWRCVSVSLDSVIATGKNIYLYSTPGRKAAVLTQILQEVASRNLIQLQIDTIYNDPQTESRIIRAKGLNTASNWQTRDVLVKERRNKN